MTVSPIKTVTVDVEPENMTFVRSFYQFAAIDISNTGMTWPPTTGDLTFIGGVTVVAPAGIDIDTTVIMKTVIFNPGDISSIGFKLTKPGPVTNFPVRVSVQETGDETQTPNDEIHISGIHHAGESWQYDFYAAGKGASASANVTSVIVIAQLR